MDTKAITGKEAAVIYISQERETFIILVVFVCTQTKLEVVCFDRFHHSCTVTLSDVSVLGDCLCPKREHHDQRLRPTSRPTRLRPH